MRRFVPIALLLAVVVVVVVVLATRTGDEPYRVRAIFDNAGFVIPGEDVKVAGVKVGKISALDVTRDFKAVVVLEIEDAAYQDFRRDAECSVRPQSLIGEKFVECEPTQKRAPGAEEEPKLETISDGPGKGQHLLPVENTSKAVDLDLINNITREPERARLSIILSELGTGLAGRGRDLNDVIRRADPALKEVDKVLEILASENETLQKLAVDGDAILAPLARERRRVSSAIANSAAVARATAERRDDLAADIERLPRFLQELRPTMVRLGAFADQATPVLSDLGDVAPDINRLLTELGPFSEAGIPALESLGEAAKVGIPAVQDARPVIADLRRLARGVRPLGATAARLLDSLRKTRGFERALDYVFYQVAAINGFDSFGHYLRAGLIANQCSVYAIDPTPGCSAKFAAAATATSSGAIGPRDQVLRRTADAIARALSGRPPAPERTGTRRKRRGREKERVPRLQPTPSPKPEKTPSATPAPSPAAPAVPPAAATPVPTASATPAPVDPADGLFDYLFGTDEQ